MDNEDLQILAERLSSIGRLADWSAVEEGLIEVRSDAGFSMYRDQGGYDWNVFGATDRVERIQVDLATEALSAGSPYDDE